MTTDRVCSSCGLQTLKFFPKQNRWRCTNEDCGDDFPIEAEATGSATAAVATRTLGLAGIDVAHLPTCIALPLADLAREAHPVVRCWRVCDAAEMLLRLAVAIGASELGHATGRLPEAIAREALGRIERPLLFDWLTLALVLAEQPPRDDALVPELRASVVQVLYPLLTGRALGETADKKKAGIADAVLTLRNQLAHGAGFSTEQAAAVLVPHEARLAAALGDLGWLREVQLVATGPGGVPVVLAGSARAGIPQTLPLEQAVAKVLASVVGEVALVRGGCALPLFPLQAFLAPEILKTQRGAALVDDAPAPLVYARAEKKHLELTALGSTVPIAELRASAVDRLRTLFRLDERDALLGRAGGGFEEEVETEARRLVGRRPELDAILAAIEETASGALWIHGLPGTGKSALMSAVALCLRSSSQKPELGEPPDAEDAIEARWRRCRKRVDDRLAVFYRFREGDPRNNRLRFLKAAVAALEGWKRLSAPPVEGMGDDPAKLETRLGELIAKLATPLCAVFLLDGLDEIARTDPGFLDLPLRLAHGRALWVCAGRPEERLTKAFAPAERCRHLFGERDGLRPLNATEIGAWLKRDAPVDQRDQIVRAEPTAAPAPWIEEVARRSGGLPAYVALLLDDLRTKEVQVGALVPKGLTAYFNELIQRSGSTDKQAALPYVLAVVAMAAEAPDLATIAEVLRRGGHLHPATREKHAGIVADAIERARAMVKTVRLEDGGEGYLPYHDEFAAHIEKADELANARAFTRDGWRAIAWEPATWKEVSELGVDGERKGVVRRAYDGGVRQLLKLGEAGEASGLLSSFEYLIARMEALGPDGARGIVEDLNRVEAAGCRARDFEPWARFLRERAHLMARGGATTLLQVAVAEADASPVTQAAEAWLAGGHWRKPWLRRVGRPKEVVRTACLRTLEGHSDHVRAVALHADGRRAVSASDDKTLKVWDLESGACLRTLEGHSDQVWAVALHPDGRRAVSASADKTLKVWDLENGACLRTLDRVALSQEIANFEVSSGARAQLGHSGIVTAVAVHADGWRVVSASSDCTLKVWDLESGACLRTLCGSKEKWIRDVVLHPDGRRAVACDDDGTLWVWDLESGACLRRYQTSNSVKAVALHPDGRWAMAACRDKTLKLWDLESKVELGERGTVRDHLATSRGWLRTLEGHSSGVTDVAVHKDGRRAVSASWDGTLKVWDLESGVCLQTLHGHSDMVNAVVLHQDGLRAVSASSDHTLKLWDLESEAHLRTPDGHSSLARAIALHPDGRRAVSASGRRDQDNTLKVWDLKSGAWLQTLEGHSESVCAVAFHPDGRRVVSASTDKTLKVWDLESGACLRTWEVGYPGRKWVTLPLHPDGRRVMWQNGSSLEVWDLESGAALQYFIEHSLVNAVALHPNGRQAVSASDDETTVKLWDVETGACSLTLQGHSSAVLAVALHPDGRRAMSASRDETLKVWDLETGVCLRTLAGHSKKSTRSTLKERLGTGVASTVNAVALHPDGRWAVSGSDDKTLKVWDLASGACLAVWNADATVETVMVSTGLIVAVDSAGNVLLLQLADGTEVADR